jgi:hypothetical protein
MAYSAIIKPTDYFNTKLYTGTDNSNAITGVGFQPDWVWLKNRSTGSNKLMDAVRGSNSSLCTNNSNAAEGAAYFSSFDSNGFTVDTSSSDVNADGQNYVGWNWKANGQGSSNTDGTINSTYTSASTASGFSIVKYQGTGSNATVGHGLGAVPKMIIIKCLQQTHWWFTYHVNIGNTKHVTLNTTNAESGASANYWNNTTPTSSVFSIGTDTGTNESGSTYIAYCFADIQGFSKAGSYTGNGNADGPMIYTGFKPAWILLKRFDSGTLDWNMYDSKRLGYNGGDAPLFANLTNAESNDYGRIDFVSNGFKIRSSNDQVNNNGGSFLYMAFAETPFVANSGESIPTTAR